MPPLHAPLAVWSWRAQEPWRDQQLQILIRELQAHAFNCRIMLLDITPASSNLVRWKPFANLLALVGPESEMQLVKANFEKLALSMKATCSEIAKLSESSSSHELKETVRRTALEGWVQLNPHQ
jgi:hypothetical protein